MRKRVREKLAKAADQGSNRKESNRAAARVAPSRNKKKGQKLKIVPKRRVTTSVTMGDTRSRLTGIAEWLCRKKERELGCNRCAQDYGGIFTKSYKEAA